MEEVNDVVQQHGEDVKGVGVHVFFQMEKNMYVMEAVPQHCWIEEEIQNRDGVDEWQHTFGRERYNFWERDVTFGKEKLILENRDFTFWKMRWYFRKRERYYF